MQRRNGIFDALRSHLFHFAKSAHHAFHLLHGGGFGLLLRRDQRVHVADQRVVGLRLGLLRGCHLVARVCCAPARIRYFAQRLAVSIVYFLICFQLFFQFC